jgi:hypothetical protein
MPTAKRLRATPPPLVVDAVDVVVRRVGTRLSRMEALLLEMRAEQDVKLKKINKLQQLVEELTEAQRGKHGRR